MWPRWARVCQTSELSADPQRLFRALARLRAPMKLGIRSDIICSQAGDRMVVALVDGSESVILNTTGSRLWEAMEGKGNFDSTALEGLLRQWYPSLSQETVEKDVEQFLGKLLTHQLVERLD